MDLKSPDVVIPAYNGSEVISNCIDSVSEILPDSRIIVVDDFSLDDTLEKVRSTHPMVEVLENSENIGFGQTCNAGISHSSSEWVLILNQDATIEKFNFSKIVGIASDPRVDIIGGQILDNNNSRQDNIGRLPNLPMLYLHWPLLPLRFIGFNSASLYENDHGKYAQTLQVPWITGSCLLLRRKSFEKYGGFDSRFFLYVEEFELANRVRNFGNKIIFEPTLISRHENRSGGQITSKAIFHTLRGQRIFITFC